MEDMALYCDSIIVMSDSKILMHKPCTEVFSEYRELVAIGLDVPQITRVASALAENGIDIGRDVYTVNWAAEKLGEYIASGKTPPESEEKIGLKQESKMKSDITFRAILRGKLRHSPP